MKFVTSACKPQTVKERRRLLFEKACASLTSDPNTPHTSVVSNCIVRAGRAEFGWEFYKNNKELNYTLLEAGEDVGSYSNELSTGWAEELYQRIWPEVDFQSMDEYFSRDLCFEEIENAPQFTNFKLREQLHLTFLQKKDLTPEPAEVVQYGNVAHIELNTQAPCADTSNSSVYKKAYKAQLERYHSSEVEFAEEPQDDEVLWYQASKDDFIHPLINEQMIRYQKNANDFKRQPMELDAGNTIRRREKRAIYRGRIRLGEPRSLELGFNWMLRDALDEQGIQSVVFESDPLPRVLRRPTSEPAEEQRGNP